MGRSGWIDHCSRPRADVARLRGYRFFHPHLVHVYLIFHRMLFDWAGEEYKLQSRVDIHGTPRLEIDYWLRSPGMKAVVEVRYVQSLGDGGRFDPESMWMVVRVSRPGRYLLVDETPMSIHEVEALLTHLDAGREGFDG